MVSLHSPRIREDTERKQRIMRAERMSKGNGSLSRLALATGIGLAIGAPFGWILSYAAALPFFLGVFFFALLGLFLDAAVYRAASPAMPYSPGPVWASTALVILWVWGLSLAKEAHDFPHDMAYQAIQRTKDLEGRSPDVFRAAVADEVKLFLRNQYPPGGWRGYGRWLLRSGEIGKTELPSVRSTLRVSQAKGWWVARVLLSLMLLTFGVSSQTFLLKKPPMEARRSPDGGPPGIVLRS